MLTDKDIKKLTKALVSREEFHTANTKVLEDYIIQEMKMLSAKVDRHEKWILQIAEKLDLKLKT